MTWYDAVVMRTIIELPQEQLDALDGICRREQISRAEAVRQAVALLVEQKCGAMRTSAFGLWRDRGIDGLTYQQRIRSEWSDSPVWRKRR